MSSIPSGTSSDAAACTTAPPTIARQPTIRAIREADTCTPEKTTDSSQSEPTISDSKMRRANLSVCCECRDQCQGSDCACKKAGYGCDWSICHQNIQEEAEVETQGMENTVLQKLAAAAAKFICFPMKRKKGKPAPVLELKCHN